MTSAPPKDWNAPAAGQIAGQQGFDVDYLGVGKDFAQAAQATPSAPTWAQRVQGNAGFAPAAPLTPTEQSTLDQTELSLQYPDLTPEEWGLLHNPEDIATRGLSMAEFNQLQDVVAKWVKCGTDRQEWQSGGYTYGVYSRGNQTLYEITQPDGFKHSQIIDTSYSNARYTFSPQGEFIRTGTDGFQIAVKNTGNTVFTDCSRSGILPQKGAPLSEKVNHRKGDVGARILPDGQIIIGDVRGTVKDHQFIVKSPNGIFITVDSKGQPMLADLNKLPSHIALTEQDVANQQAFAMQVATGERSLTEIVRQETPQEKAARPGAQKLSKASIDATRRDFKQITDLNRNGQLPYASEVAIHLNHPDKQQLAQATTSRSR